MGARQNGLVSQKRRRKRERVKREGKGQEGKERMWRRRKGVGKLPICLEIMFSLCWSEGETKVITFPDLPALPQRPER